ncbi:MAG: hypothetical protein HOI95_12220 [Chromatiales bacterium]|jgi:drug/metabolite transporter (DMT)-like permease|nr:hypothetical protein [Chromatiales bacterium]
MSVAVGFGLLSMLFTGMIDVIYKVYAVKARSRGMFLCTMGVVWGAVQAVTWAASETAPSLSLDGASYALAAGVFLTVSNIALIEAMTHIPVSLGSTVYRLNTVGVVLLAWLLLGETLGVVKLGGLACGIAAVLVLYQRGSAPGMHRLATVYFLIALAASCMRAGYGVTSKAGLAEGVDANLLMFVSAGCWIVGGLAYAALRERTLSMSVDTLRIGLLAGAVVYGIVNSLMAGLEAGEASVVVPISNLGFVTAIALSVGLGWEAMNLRKVSALVLAALAIALLAQS